MTLDAGTCLGPYEIRSLLGRGGMGEVYKARDTRLGRDVAIKVLPAQSTGNPELRRRFEREARAICRLQHPGVCTLFDVGSDRGLDYLVMEHLEGETLEVRLRRGALPPGQVLEVGAQIAEAIDAAHRRGLVHRDLKPGNVMLTPAGAKVLDFGLARELVAVPAGADTLAETLEKGLTEAGTLAGTLPYMAPEQLQGKLADARTDVWALGCALYEMAAGTRPFRGETQADLVSSIMTAEPGPPSRRQPLTPERFDWVVERCLEKDAERRWQSARDVAIELEAMSGRRPAPGGAEGEAEGGSAARRRPVRLGAVAAAAVAALVVVALVTVLRREPPAPLPGADPKISASNERKMIVVLPFENLGPEEQEYFAAGITEEITSRLAVAGGLGVISRLSAVQYGSGDKSLRQIGEELGVDYVLEGSVRFAPGERVRITPLLIRVADDTNLWSHIYDQVVEDIFAVQEEIAGHVIEQLGVTLLASEEARGQALPTSSMEAYDAYLYGLAVESRPRSAENNQLALDMYGKAVRLDPEFALAWARLSEAHSRLFESGRDRTPSRLKEAQTAARRALQLDPELPEGHRALGRWHREDGDFAAAARELEIARAGLPSDSGVLAVIAEIRRREGDLNEAQRLLERAIVLDPRSAELLVTLGGLTTARRDYEAADSLYERALELQPDRTVVEVIRYRNSTLWKGFQAAGYPADAVGAESRRRYSGYLAWIALHLGRHQEALERIDGMAEDWVEGGIYFPRDLQRAWVYTDMGEHERASAAYESARRTLEGLAADAPNDPRYQSSLAYAYAGLGRKEEAIRHGLRSVELVPLSQEAINGPYRLRLARIYALVGEPDLALDLVEEVLALPFWYSVAEMEEEPFFDAIRDHPRYRALVERHR